MSEDKKPVLYPCPFCGSEMTWIDTHKDFTADRFLCGARCKNPHCCARITFDAHNYSRSMFAKKFNHRVSVEFKQQSIFSLED